MVLVGFWKTTNTPPLWDNKAAKTTKVIEKTPFYQHMFKLIIQYLLLLFGIKHT